MIVDVDTSIQRLVARLRADIAAAQEDVTAKNRTIAMLKIKLREAEAERDALRTGSKLDYQAYLKSPHWKQVREGAVRRAGWRCQLCGRDGLKRELHVHHNRYKNLGREQPEDIIVLCKGCHKRHHDAEKSK